MWMTANHIHVRMVQRVMTVWASMAAFAQQILQEITVKLDRTLITPVKQVRNTIC